MLLHGEVEQARGRRSGNYSNSYGTVLLPEHKVVGEGEQESEEKVR
jgi:hypothetical protein